MKIEKQLNVTADEFFNVVTQSLLHDYKTHTNKTIHESQIKEGLTYNKRINGRSGKNSKVEVKLLKYIPGKVYMVSFDSKIDKITLSYEIQEIDTDHIRIDYEENYVSKSNQPDKKEGFFSKRIKIRKVEKLLSTIEKSIIQNREK